MRLILRLFSDIASTADVESLQMLRKNDREYWIDTDFDEDAPNIVPAFIGGAEENYENISSAEMWNDSIWAWRTL